MNEMASTSDSSTVVENRKSLVEQFRSVTGTDDDKASKMLEMCNWNLEMAVNMHVDLDYPENNQNVFKNNLRSTTTLVDDVRPPIPPSREILVEENLSVQYAMRGRKRRPTSIFDGFRDFQAEAQWQEVNSGIAASDVQSNAMKKRRTLEDIFRPPLDLMHRGTFDSAREAGQQANRWLMVNIQNSYEFSCQVLNRDIWSNPNVKNIISEHFVFWQVYCDSAEGQRYIQFYRPVEYPYVAILDPRTGENLVVWNKIEATSFFDVVRKFLNECSSPEGSCQSSQKSATSLLDVSEEQQIRAAMEASLKEMASSSNVEEESDIETFDSDSESQSKMSKISELDLKSDSTSDTIDVVNCSDSQDTSHESWKKHLGEDTDPTSELVLRLPDGKREQIKWPCTSKLEALQLFIQTFGYDQEKYELVTNFPRKNLSHIESSKTLKDVGLFPRETVFVQLKSL